METKRKLASVQRIADLQPIPGADAIEVATILGWQVVVKKGEFKVNDLCVYIEIDSIVPEWEIFEFLRERKFRIKTIKLRKQVSQGIAFPLHAFGVAFHGWRMMFDKGNPPVGTDVTDLLQIKKHDPQAEQEAAIASDTKRVAKNRFDKFLMRYSWWRRLTAPTPNRRPFPSWISKTDETRIQNRTHTLANGSEQEWIVTEKLDGQSGTYFAVVKKTWWGKVKNIFGVCSRNFQLLKQDDSSYWTVARQFDIQARLNNILLLNPDFKAIALQGEILGQRIQGNKYKVEGYDYYVFNYKVWLDNGEVWDCDPANVKAFIDGENKTGQYKPLKTVPILAEGFKLPKTIQELVEYSKGTSVLLKSQLREGVVIRSRNLDNRTLAAPIDSFKVINPDFLLKCEE